MLKLLDKFQEVIFKKNILQKRKTHKDLKRNIEILYEATTIKRPTKKERYDGYLKYIEKEFKKGKITLKEFKRIKRLNPSLITTTRDGKTSKDVAKKFLGSSKKDARIRKIVSRLKKEIQKKS